MHKLVATVLLISAVATACGGDAALREPGQIVFSARPDAADASGWQLFIVNADGGGLERLTRTDGDTSPVWSPDGSQIAFIRCCRGDALGAETDEIWLIDRDGNEEYLTTGYGASWSPDGEEIAFTRQIGGFPDEAERYEVRVANVKSGPERLLLADGRAPVWSPDGDYIVFERGRPEKEQLYVMRADGSDVRTLTQQPGDSCADWSPDSEEIAFANYQQGGVYVIDADGSDLRRVATTTISDRASLLSCPVWSPDGRRLAFSALAPDEESEIIVIADLNEGKQRRLSPLRPEFVTDSQPVWSPDGQRIAFVNDEASLDGGLWVMNSDGTDRRPLTRGPFTEADEGMDWAADASS
jgi:Tol biopolymer transport system component